MAEMRPLMVWWLGDGKPGHENQSLGLVEAMSRMCSCEVHRITLGQGAWWARLRRSLAMAKSLPRPDVIVGTGHATHVPLWYLGWRYRASRVVLMKPSLPMWCFDWCLAPEHDFPQGSSDRRLLLTRGALNRVVPGVDGASGRLVLLGGPSKSHGWDEEAMLSQLKQVCVGDGWDLTDSRRTPAGFIDRVVESLPQVTVHPHSQTGPDWLPTALSQAAEVWVTEDSVSMIYEALSSGARVGVLSVPRIKQQSRVLAGMDRLMEEGYLTSFALWQERGELLSPPQPLREADRCASLLVKSWLQQVK